jgi:opacity protein-like surface antigen
MNMKKLFTTTLICLFFSIPVFSQSGEDSTGNHNRHHWSHWKNDFNFIHEGFNGRPTLSFLYGFSNMSLREAQRSYADPNLMELKIGYTSKRSTWDDDNIFNYSKEYLQLSYFSTELANTPNNPDVQSKMWRFGFGKASGYGYDFGDFNLVPYHASGLTWSRVEMLPDKVVTFAALPPSGLEDFDQTIRFGTSAEGGLRFTFADHYTLEAGYERSIIFRRHLFAKWAMSAIIEDATQSLLDGFIDEILDYSPKAVPVVNFLLKNALSYGIYELRQSKMNWPFNTEAPLSYDQFKFGVTIVF